MKQHPTDLVALLFGLAFAIAGALVIVTQATSVDVSPQWGAAVGLIVLGVVALVATVARGHDGTVRHDGAPLPQSHRRADRRTRGQPRGSSRLTTSAIGTSSRVPVARSLRSTIPFASPSRRPRAGPARRRRSASANFTPGLTSRSS